MRVAFFIEGRPRWMAGYTYLQNLVEAIRLADREVEICLLRKPNEDVVASPARAVAELADRVLVCPALSPPRGSFEWMLAKLYGRAFRREKPDRTLDDFLATKGVNVVFGSWWQYTSTSAFPSVGMCSWIHDFQFLHLPRYYATTAVEESRRGVLRTVDVAARVVVSSRDALADLLSLSPIAAAKARALPFVAAIPEETYVVDPGSVARHYHLPSKFAYLPNQFWQHKNHRLVLEALRILSGRGVRPTIVCTGLPLDTRTDTHFSDLLRQVSEWGLHGQLYFLGLVPLEHVRALMRQSVCILNPSLFEGWSSTVEEAKSLGKRLLLSDLAVHREQDPPAAAFFDPVNPEALAVELELVWRDGTPGPDLELETQARQTLPTRMREFGERFLEIAAQAARAG